MRVEWGAMAEEGRWSSRRAGSGALRAQRSAAQAELTRRVTRGAHAAAWALVARAHPLLVAAAEPSPSSGPPAPRRRFSTALARRAQRGAALAEAALIFPAVVAVVMGAGVATELLLARLEVQEAARFAAWELASDQVADIRGGDPRGRFRASARRVEGEAARRYPLTAPFVSGTGVELAIDDAHAGGSPPAAWRFSPDGRADAVARARVEGVALEERASVIVDPWNLADGADVVGSAGPSGLWLQIDRMKHQPRRPVPDLRSVGLPRPDVAGPFVVSRGYRPAHRGACLGLPGYPASALGGLEDLGDRLDAPQPRCFDTSPFRDTQEYAASLSAQMYRMRSAP